jgi:hypothetical protein
MSAESDSVPFSWKDTESVVIEKVDAIAVYTNPKGDLVIRQEDPRGDDDAIIIVPKSRARDLIMAIQSELDE